MSASRRLDRPTVAAILREFPFAAISRLHGFDLDPPQELGRGFRLQHGGGIAGNGCVWWIWRKDGSDGSDRVSTRSGLRRILREHLAARCSGPRPGHRSGYVVYARRNRNLFGESWIWAYRRTPTSKEQIAP